MLDVIASALPVYLCQRRSLLFVGNYDEVGLLPVAGNGCLQSYSYTLFDYTAFNRPIQVEALPHGPGRGEKLVRSEAGHQSKQFTVEP